MNTQEAALRDDMLSYLDDMEIGVEDAGNRRVTDLVLRYVDSHPDGVHAGFMVVYDAVGDDGRRKLEQAAQAIISERN